MGLDIRWPIGLMFTLIGVIMVVYGLVTGSGAEIYQRSLGMNVNLYWGLLLVVFGGAMLTAAWKGSQAPSGTDDSTKPQQADPPSSSRK